MRTSLFSLAIGAVLITPVAHAADLDVFSTPELAGSGDFYIAARIIGAFMGDTDFDLTVVQTNIINNYDEPGIGGAVALGYEFDSGAGYGLRAELEGGILSNTIDSHTIVALPATLSGANAFGETQILYGMVNVALDYDLGNGFKPFVGAGVGWAQADFKNHGVTLAAAVGPLGPGNVTAMNDADNGLIWQIGGGIGYEVTENITLEAAYRYMQVENISLTAVDGTVSNVPIHQHQGLLGVRYGF